MTFLISINQKMCRKSSNNTFEGKNNYVIDLTLFCSGEISRDTKFSSFNQFSSQLGDMNIKEGLCKK